MMESVNVILKPFTPIDLSIIVPSIRVDNLPALYNSLYNACSAPFEVIVVGPYKPPILDKFNVRYIEDWGAPLRAQQIGLSHARGKYIHRAVDDSAYLKDSLDKALALIDRSDPLSCVNVKFTEGESLIKDKMMLDEFYELGYHSQAIKLYTPFKSQVMNFSIIPSSLMGEIGGWDAKTFETIAFGELDISLRLQFAGAKPQLTKYPVIACTWLPGETGDHKPMNDAFADDAVIYNRIYNSVGCHDRIKIDINNWKDTPNRWIRRFGDA